MKVLAVSDVTLGYGTPQLPLMVESLAAHYGAQGHVIEPVQPELPARHGLFPSLQIERVVTAYHPHGEIGRREYIARAAKRVNEIRPAVLVICCTYSLPVIFRLDYRPEKVIYYSVESIPFYGPFDMEMNRYAGPLVDVVVFPEENRAVREVERFGFTGAVKLVLYNATNPRETEPLPPGERNGRILYSGTISRAHTFADYYAQPRSREFPIDLFGPLKFADDAERGAWLGAVGGAVRYRGYVDARELGRLRKEYAFSIVSWSPSNENQQFAAPNKFFDSIADGIPPIAAPHPQCRLLIERYHCGILMDDWGYEAFRKAIRKALRIYGAPAWEEMIGNCRRAVESELNWEAQFTRLIPHLRPSLTPAG